MNSSGSAYTSLETLLLFQCLHAYGVGASVFGRISDLLKKIPDITGHKYFQAGRLSPDALRNFYLERLRREIEYEQGGDSEGQNGDLTNSSKRKRHSPSLPTVQESLQHQHLLPKLVTKLYSSYRNEIAEQIRAEEERYERLQRDIKSIERGEWDEQLRERANGRVSASRSPTLPRRSPHLAPKPLQPNASSQPVQPGAQGGPVNAPVPDSVQQPVLPLQNGQPPQSPRKKQTSTDPRRTPSTPQPLHNPTQPTVPPTFQQPPNSGHNGPPYPNISPYPPAQQPQAPQTMQPQPIPPQRFLAHSPALGSPGPQLQPQQVPSFGGSPVVHRTSPPGAPLPYTPAHQHSPQQQPPGIHSPGLQAHQQQRAQHAPLLPQMGQPPPQAGFMLPPFQVSPQDPSRVHHQAPTQQQYPPVSTPVNNRQQPLASRTNVQTPGTSRPGMPPMHPLVIQARQSFSTPMSNRSPHSAIGTPVSAKSLWKRHSFPTASGTPASPRPEVEPLDDVPPLIRPKQSPSKPKAQRKPKAKAKGKEKEKATGKGLGQEPALESDHAPDPEQSNDQEEEPMLELGTRTGRSRRKVANNKRLRPGSIASSRAGGSVRGRSRSQSILSHTETVAGDNDSQAGHRIKSERANSVDAIEEESTSTPSQMSTRRRGIAAQAAPSTRRKRNAREASLGEPEDHFNTPGPIIAQRHFSRMCHPIMNDINSHKHASTFTTAVRAKDAEGYYDIIKRPTDLKSIQKAITTGAKQVAATASDTPAASPGGNGGVVELPLIPDNVPPKAIVNAAQLEKELMRMFVNAVMFNPGEDGVVEDAREMFESVQRSVSNWRNVERSSGRTEVEDTPAAEEEEQPTASKRRKV